MVQTKPGMDQGGLSKAGLLSGDVAPLLCDRLLDRSRVHLRLCADLLRRTLVEEIVSTKHQTLLGHNSTFMRADTFGTSTHSSTGDSLGTSFVTCSPEIATVLEKIEHDLDPDV